MTTPTQTPGIDQLMLVINSDAAEFAQSLVPGTQSDAPLILKDLPIFRSGSFRNSYGDPVEVTEYDIQQIVRNFDYLKSSGRFDQPPAREGHRSSYMLGSDPIASVIGYITGVSSEKRKYDGEDYEFLLGDFEILREDAKANIKSGLWRKRSAEIGIYRDNQGGEYAPTLMGLGFVDIPAVEGLDSFSYVANPSEANKEIDKMTEIVLPPTGGPVNLHQFSIGQVQTTDYAQVQAYISKIEGDFAAASAEITSLKAVNKSLEEFKLETAKGVRTSFIDGLVKDKKILAPDAESEKEFALSLNEDQFSAYSKRFEKAPVLDVLGEHGVQESQRPDNDRSATAEFSQTDLDKKNLRDLRNIAGQDDDTLKKTDIYARLIKADSNFSLASI